MKSVSRLRYDCVLVLFLSFCLVFCQRVFDETPKDTEVNPREVIPLQCKVINPIGECFWLKGGGVVIPNAKYEYTRSSTSGDCSLRIMNASLQTDDGFWQCQFPSYEGQPMLQSDNAKVTVRQAPVNPYIEYEDAQLSNANLTLPEDKQSTVKCIARKGNPAATLKWFIDDNDVSSLAKEINETDTDLDKTFKTTSILKYTFQKEHNGKLLKCVSLHKAYDTGSRDVETRLNVLYRPKIKIEGPPKQNVEEGQILSLACIADGNPSPNVFWSKDYNTFSSRANITFSSVKRTDAGQYRCRAKNDVGESEELTITVNVNFPPRVLSIEPSTVVTANLYDKVTLKCDAEGNPLPKYSWIQIASGNPDTSQRRGNTATLTIHNITYSYEGMYVCIASNVINGKMYETKSDKKVALNVRGPPQIEHHDKLVVEKDENADIIVVFCADPQPVKTYWEWGSVQLNSGSNLPRYVAKSLMKIEDRKDCYEARLIVQNVVNSDSRKYTFVAENEKGREVVDIPLEVQEPATVSAVIGIVVSCVVIVVVAVLVVLYFVKRDKCLFLRARGFKPDSDNGSTGMSEELHNGHAGDQAIPPDALYTDVGERHDYENLGRNSHKGGDNIVYADLDLQSLETNKNNPQKKVKPKLETTEYAEIQFTPKKSGTQADI